MAEETRLLFEHIKSNRYAAAGEFQWPLLRDDLHVLVTKVAHIYQPGVAQPLLETSLERVLRAGGRACLQFLVVLDDDGHVHDVMARGTWHMRGGVLQRLGPFESA